MRTNNVTSNRPDVAHLKESNNNNNNINNNVVEENKSIPDSSQTIKNTDTHSHISAQDSFVVVSPKPSKIMNPHMIANSSPINKDSVGPTILSENQTAFRKPGCFQAVPVTIPSVHTSVRKKEAAENEQKVQYTNVNECKIQNSSVKNQQNDQKNQSSIGIKGFQTPAESNKQSGFVGDIVNQINSSVKTDKNIAQYDHKTVASSVQQSNTVQNAKSEFKRIDMGPPIAKPGFPVKIVNSQPPDSSQLPKDIPPDLPKKEKKALQNATFTSDSNKTISTINPSQNSNHDIKKLPSEKLSKVVPAATNRDHGKHGSTGLAEHPRAHQNKIAIENSRNTKKDKCEGYSMNVNTKQHKSEMTKKDTHDSSKQCSSDKRFQKVLPPVDKTFSLKPCSARKSINLGDTAEHTGEIPKVPEHQKSDKTVDSIPPSIPPKVNMQQTNMHYIDKNCNDPPMIPPKKSANATKILQAPKENISNKDNAAKFPAENLTQRRPLNANEQRASKNEEIISKLNVDIVEVKDANNEKNVQLQKGNMPDLISKIIPNEKNDLILIEDGKIEKNVKTEKEDLGNNKSYITNKEKSMQEKDAPESPKSPKRQSWFFGTHKNSLVFPVIILKNPELGFSIEGGIGSPRNPAKPNDNGIYVAHVLADGPASNSLRPGDKILQVDGTDFTQLDHNKALAVLQESGSTVSLMISRE